MKLLEQVHSGKRQAPRRVLLYGTEGIGKSTFGAMRDKPIFLQIRFRPLAGVGGPV